MKNAIKISIKSEVVSLVIIGMAIVLGVYFYQNFPSQVPTHWNSAGQIDGYSNKTLGAFLLPAIMIGIYLILLLIPNIDPRKARYMEFAKSYNVIRTSILAYLLFIYFYTGLAGLGYDIDVEKVIPVTVGLLFIIIGNYMSKIKPNWFFGIRTPWTLSSETVWQKTHQLGGKVFVLIGLLIVALSVIPLKEGKYFTILMSIIVTASLTPIIYSYVIYKKEKK